MNYKEKSKELSFILRELREFTPRGRRINKAEDINGCIFTITWNIKAFQKQMGKVQEAVKQLQKALMSEKIIRF